MRSDREEAPCNSSSPNPSGEHQTWGGYCTGTPIESILYEPGLVTVRTSQAVHQFDVTDTVQLDVSAAASEQKAAVGRIGRSPPSVPHVGARRDNREAERGNACGNR
ncbi:hypothetical protein [Nocardia carnea]|uniref:hypothetical protein n=1 Tax=Nocardia carnea TaxID=37328 RepID=UPI00245397DD|nr:hypothetical protein [Nocardia carnea]